MKTTIDPANIEAEEPPALEQSSPRQRSAHTRQRILLVDDDPSVCASLAKVLELEDYRVELASDGLEAIRKFRSWQPDLVLLDLNMPRADGWTAFERMEQDHPFVPFVVITARPHQYDRAVCAGIDAFMEKPLNLPVLLNTVRQLLCESEAQRIARLADRDFKTEDLNVEGAPPNHATVSSDRR